MKFVMYIKGYYPNVAECNCVYVLCVLQITEWTHTVPDKVITQLFGKVSYQAYSAVMGSVTMKAKWKLASCQILRESLS